MLSIAPGGVPDTQKGLDYQWKILTLLACRAFILHQDIKFFELYSEVTEAGVFDDVILKYTDHQNIFKYIFIQAKHRKNAQKINLENLIADKRFSIHKYIKSFWQILETFNIEDVDSVMIATNNSFDDPVGGNILEMSFHQDNINYSCYFESKKHFIFDNLGKIYHFVGSQKSESEKRAEVFYIIKIIVVSFELESLLSCASNNFLFLNQKYLFNTIIDKNSLKFKKGFVNGNLAGFEFLRKIILDVIGNNLKNLKKIESKFINIFIKHLDNTVLISNQEKADDAINKFLDKLMYVTSLETMEIQSKINLILQEIFMRDNVDQISKGIENNIREWFMSTNDNKAHLTKIDFENFVLKSKLEIESIKLAKLKEVSFSDMLHFDPQLTVFSELDNFFTARDSRVLHLQTSEDEIHFAGMRVLSIHHSKTEKEDTLLFLSTLFSEENYKLGVEIFEKLESFKLLVVEVYNDSIQNFVNSLQQLENILQNLSKKVVIIANKNLVTLTNVKTTKESESHFSDLTTDSKDRILNKKISFQLEETSWEKVLDGHDLSKISLKDIVNSGKIGVEIKISKSFNEVIYIPRTIVFKNFIKASILQKDCRDVFVFDNDEFMSHSKSDIPHHLLGNLGSELQWLQSTQDLSIILENIDENNSKTDDEEKLAEFAARVVIVSDVAGMGKSSLFYNLANILKKRHPDYWVYKADLNDHTDALDELTKINFESPEKAVEFLANEIIKIASNFEKTHFINSCCHTGKSILLIDGVDEIFSCYGEEVLDLIMLLLKSKISNIFISTRPECSELLEQQFLQIKHALMPFTEDDQKKYFSKFLCNKEHLRHLNETKIEKIVENFMGSLKNSITARDYKHTGIPLVTKLVAEYLDHKISQIDQDNFNQNVDSLKLEKFNLWNLYGDFISKSCHVYFKEKCGIDEKKMKNRKIIENLRKKIIENYKIYAIQQFLQMDARIFFQEVAKKSFDDDEIEDMVKVGLIYKTEAGYKFTHQTFAENLFTLYLKDHFDEEEVIKFIVDEVFIERRYNIIRSFIEYWIEEKMARQSYENFCNFILESSAKHTTPVHVLSEDQNPKTLYFIYNCLLSIFDFLAVGFEL
jgi:hypothetical protein